MKDLVFLEGITASVHSQDTQKRLKAADDLSNYLSDPSNNVEFLGFDKLLDGIVTWINSSNYRISVAGLDLLHQLVDRLGREFRHHLLPVVPGVTDRLGDSKQQVRDLAQDLLQKFMYPVSTPQHVLEQLVQGFGHKSWRVREEVLQCLVRTINSFGASSVTVSKFVPHICKLLGDPNSQVRDKAINTLVEIYRHVGEKVRIDLAKKGIPSSRLSLIYAKFDEVARSGNMVVEEDSLSKVNGEVETDGAKMPSRTSSVSKRGSVRKTSSGSSSGSGSKGAAATGAVDETDFAQAFEETPEARIFSGKELSDEMTQIQTTLSDSNNDWEKRVAAVKKVRSLVIAGAMEYDNFSTQLRLMEGAFKLSAKDLRSTVVREACITIGFLSTRLKNQFDHTAEAVFPTLVNLIPNSAKIMATCGDACIRIILKNTHAHRLIPIITHNCTSKSSIIRRRMAEYMDLFLQFWSTSTIKGHVHEIEQSITKMLSDADAEARAAARRAFWRFAEHYRDKADSLLKSLDSSKQKQLENDRNLSNVGPLKSSSSSRFSAVKPTKSASTRSRTSSARSDDGLSSRSGPSRQTVGASSSYGSAASSHRDETRHAIASRSASGFLAPMPSWGRSLSNIDQRAASRASTRAKSSRTSIHHGANRTAPPPRQSRSQVPSRGTCSQPGSRTQSPERLFAQFSPRERSENFCKGVSPTKSKIPTPSGSPFQRSYSYSYLAAKSTSSRSSSRASSRTSSRASSRGTSPERMLRRMSSSERAGYSPSHLPVLKRNNAQASLYNPPGTRTQQQGDVAKDDVTEAAIWDAWTRSPARRKFSFSSQNSQCSDDEPDDDAASMSSERSFSSRGSRNAVKECQEVSEIVRLCNSSVWNDRRDGVTALQAFLKSSRVLSQMELSKIKDALTRLFFDPHNKVYSQYLDALCDFIVIHKVDLHDWLFVLLSRLLSKLGTDILSSLQSKIVRVLDVVRDSFPYDLQFSILTRFITDQTQTPNLKVKIAVLQYLQGLISLMDPSDFTNSGETRLAVSRIITWTTEPKSGEVRKESAAVIVALFELNTPEFSMMLSVLPKSFQDGATKLLHNHLKSSNSGVEPIPSSRAIASPYNYDEVDRTGCSSPTSPRFRLGARTFSNSSLKGVSPVKDDGGVDYTHPETPSTDRISSPRMQRFPRGPSPLQRDNSAEMQSKFAYQSPRNGGSPLARGSSVDSADTGSDRGSPVPRVLSPRDTLEDAPSLSSGYNSDGDIHNVPSEPHATHTISAHKPSNGPQAHEYDPKQYQGNDHEDFHPVPEMNGFVTTGKKKKEGEVVDELDRSLEGMEHSDDQFDRNVPLEMFDAMGPILDTLMSGGLGEEKKSALCELQKLIREDAPGLWDESFKRIYSAVMKVVEDEEPSVRSLALRVVRDMVRLHPNCFISFSHNTIAKVLEAHNDEQKEVVRLAEEAAMTIARLLPPEECLQVLGPLLRDAEFPVNLAAIKMITKVIEGVDSDTVAESLAELIPGLVRCYDHAESSVRKASVFCLVAIHNTVGEEVLLPHLAELSGTKMKLLNLYIKRSQAANGGGR